MLKTEGDAFVGNLIDSFSCKYNADVDSYLKEDAVLFTAMSSTVTHFVFDSDTGLCVAYFALTHKEQDNAKLDEFYRRNGFVQFDSRVSEEDNITYDLMFSFLK